MFEDVALRCLRIQEVLEIVMGDLHEGRNGRASVARMARTCKTFHFVAVAVLWQHIGGLVPLMSTIPGHVWEKDQRRRELLWEQPNTNRLDVSRLAFYASHIKCFTWKFDRTVNIYSAGKFLRGIPQSMVLFPAVHTIWFQDDKEWFGLLVHSHIFAGPAVEELYINACAYDAEPLFQRANRLFPRLSRLHLTGPSSSAKWPPPTLTEDTVRPLATTHISHFDANDQLSLSGLIVLGGIPTLEHVVVRLDPKRCGSSFTAPLADGHCFPALKTLQLHTGLINEITLALVEAISSPSLQRFELTVKARVYRHLGEEVLFAHLEALSRAPFRTALRDLKLYLAHKESLEPNFTVGIQILRPLLGRLNGLVSLQIFSDMIVLDNATCQGIAEAFPLLKLLTLTYEGVGSYAGQVHTGGDQLEAQRAASLEGLAFIVKHCRQLTDLRIPVQILCGKIPAFPSAEEVSTTIERGALTLRVAPFTWERVKQYLDVLLPPWQTMANVSFT
ncbi:uncharacterized protein B0H18DRAFT_1102633 [Fomitopsis serialis]|uniref:uncharacterized protein n=1 Tax=Fomitopsis serialis TaxID=139415 RepID=UPI002007766B|nr:uncharacterized protein B0H18DRAFT_1102633 [Neoantrodia serialis]KAH9931449.1 hypothetical protein B0H18DRAFT_1102633 [Neoantrodia serialis]